MEDLQAQLLHHQSTPVVFSGLINTWPASQWSVSSLQQVLGGKKIKFRIGPKTSSGVQWETECDYVEATLSEFQGWLDCSSSGSGPFKSFSPDIHWCYADYKYMSELCSDCPSMLESVDWSVLGFEGRRGEKSTFWLGSPGANTACHYDTYGCNVVAQIVGRKKWVLFPPSDTPRLYPTRIPYEESSVFSHVNIAAPDISTHPMFTNCRPHVVTLEPGQVLFVPQHWWHYVECVDTSISVNSWIEMDVDRHERLKEALARTLTFDLMSFDTSHSTGSWLNPTEGSTSHDINMAYLRSSLKEVASLSSQENHDSSSTAPSASESHKDSQPHHDPVDSITPVTSSISHMVHMRSLLGPGAEVSPLTCITWEEFYLSMDAGVTSTSAEGCSEDVNSLTMQDILECVTQPDVISLISQKLKHKLKLPS